MKRAVLTGATGVIGSALIRELLSRDYEILTVLREGSPHNARIPDDSRVTKIDCSVEHLGSLTNTTGRTWDVFFHLGWSGTKGPDRFDPCIHTENIRYALDAVQAAHRLGCSCFVGAGSQAELGRSEGRLTPDTLPAPENAYGAGKLAAGHMTRLCAHQLGMRHVWTRILSVYGPNDGEKTMITYLIDCLRGGTRPSLTAGEQVWDYLAADDAAAALAAAGERGRDGACYLIASGTERTLREYIEEIRDITAPGAEIGFGERPYAKGQVMHLTADISQTKEDLDWEPRLTFREGIRRMLDAADAGRPDRRDDR